VGGGLSAANEFVDRVPSAWRRHLRRHDFGKHIVASFFSTAAILPGFVLALLLAQVVALRKLLASIASSENLAYEIFVACITIAFAVALQPSKRSSRAIFLALTLSYLAS
jgi:hypothetical protein